MRLAWIPSKREVLVHRRMFSAVRTWIENPNAAYSSSAFLQECGGFAFMRPRGVFHVARTELSKKGPAGNVPHNQSQSLSCEEGVATASCTTLTRVIFVTVSRSTKTTRASRLLLLVWRPVQSYFPSTGHTTCFVSSVFLLLPVAFFLVSCDSGTPPQYSPLVDCVSQFLAAVSLIGRHYPSFF